MKMIQSKFAMPRFAAIATVLFAGAALLPLQASANTAANTTVRNIVTVSFADAANTAQTPVTSQVDVTVSLVKAAATLAQVTPNATIAPNGTASYTYSLTSNANGPDTQTVSTSLTTDQTPASSLSATGAIVLGASTVATAGSIAAAGTTGIIVPSDLVGGGDVNGIATGDTVVINGQVFVVASVTDNGGVGTSTITVTGNGTLTAIAVSDLIRERATFSITVTPGPYVGPGNKIVVNDTLATDGTNPSNTTVTTTTISGVTLVVTKYVRCSAGSCTNPGVADFTLGATNYYLAGVSGAPGATLEYLIRIENAVGNSTANDVVIDDPIPAFTTLSAGTLATGDNLGVFTAATAVVNDGDTGEVIGNTVYLYPGTGGSDVATGGGNPNGDGGSLAGGNSTYGRFSVLIQ